MKSDFRSKASKIGALFVVMLVASFMHSGPSAAYDYVDSDGRNYFGGGCLYQYTGTWTGTCSVFDGYTAADYCDGSGKLVEFYTVSVFGYPGPMNGCRASFTSDTVDCNDVCAPYVGSCMVDPNAPYCGSFATPAECKCNYPNATPTPSPTPGPTGP